MGVKLRYDPTVTFGNLLQAGVITVGLLSAYVRIQGTLERHDAQISATAI